jgi:cobalt-zinc-cadmium efflux system outer membrane protein
MCGWGSGARAELAEVEARASSHEQNAAVFQAPHASSLAALELAIEQGAPEVIAVQREAALSDAAARQTHLYNNPIFDTTYGTLPVGTSNPPGLPRPYANIPNVGLGVSYTFPLRKRGPRQREAAANARAAHADVDVTTRTLALELARVLGDLATATLRREGLVELEAGAERSLALAEARLSAQFGSGLDVDRSSIDSQRVKQQRIGTESEIRAQLAACASLVRRRCAGFADGAEALAFLHTWMDLAEAPPARLSDRPDLRALAAQAAAADAALDLAKAEAIPDPTLRVGYLHDRFIVAGNQRNSFNVSVSLPLPIFDHGQAKQEAAKSAQRLLQLEREQRLSRAQQQAVLLAERSELARTRCERLEREVLPRARDVLTSLEKAEAARLVSLTDVIQARRTVSELLIEEAESCGDAYDATIALLREAPRNPVP